MYQIIKHRPSARWSSKKHLHGRLHRRQIAGEAVLYLSLSSSHPW